jgi:hypothetical protein
MPVAVASIPASDGVISACFDRSSGAVRIIDADKTKCKTGERLITWNQRGLTGPQDRRASRVSRVTPD